MITTVQYILYFVVVIACLLAVYNSWKSRRTESARARGLYASRTNIFMGLMLIVIAVIQLFLFIDSWVRLIIGSIFLLIGVFNLVAGIRNHGYFNSFTDQ